MDRMKFTSFKEVILDKIKQDDLITIDIERYPDKAKVSIEDKIVVEKIWKALSAIELKQEGSRIRIGDYAVRILVNNTGSRGMQLIKGNQYIWIHDEKKKQCL
ncbi:hypothetical protein O0535_10675 [Brevibacillus halotolerans]|uniref:Uncharacterized protein n=2 Tax=Brevibacillus TaxID=55080 RepID=A0ABT4HWP8_9BACL|nr:hypothetical protein [Brevibacillus halotolerans]